MTARLALHSFHSLRGGVGRTHHAVQLARTLAATAPTVLVDLNLCSGLSLAETMPLCSPRWGDGKKDLHGGPRGGFHTRQETLALMEEPGGVVTLNDFILYAGPDHDRSREMHLDSLLWKVEPDVPGLLVIPSAFLPDDVSKVQPIVDDENHAAFIESRLEWLLNLIVADEGMMNVVFDAPAGFANIGRSCVSILLRLGSDPKQPLAQDGGTPDRLESAEIVSSPVLIVPDTEADHRAARRLVNMESAFQALVVPNR